MKKIIFSAVLVCTLAMAANAQQHENGINFGPDLYLGLKSFGDAYKAGIGGHVKGLYGVGSAGQATLTIGYASFKGKKTDFFDYSKQQFKVIPILLGYRHHFQDFFVEPQLGVGHSTIDYNDTKLFSQTKFMYAIGGGYLTHGFEVDLSFQNVGETGEIALRAGVAYNVPFHKKNHG